MAITTNVPSDRFEDLQRDVQDATRFSNGTAVFQNRTGGSITPIPLRDQQFQDALSAIGYIYKDPDTFTTGSTLNGPNEALRRASDGEYFRRVQGPFPYTVAPNTDPTTDPLYVAVGSAALADRLADVNSAQLVGGQSASTVTFNVAHLKQLATVPKVDERRYSVASFYDGWAALNIPPVGGGYFVYDASLSKAEHNGGTVIATEALAAWDGTHAGLAEYLDWVGSGNGCFVRLHSSPEFMLEFFGGGHGNHLSDTASFKKCVQVNKATSFYSSRQYYISDTIVMNGSHKIIGNNAFLNNLINDNNKYMISNNEAGLRLDIQDLTFVGRASSINMTLAGSKPELGLSLRLKNVTFTGVYAFRLNDASYAIRCRQMDFMNLENIRATNLDAFLEIDSDFQNGERDNTQIFTKNVYLHRVNTAAILGQLDKAIVNLDVNRCGTGIIFKRGNKRVSLPSTHVEFFGAAECFSSTDNGYGYIFKNNQSQSEISFGESTSFSNDEPDAIAGIYIGQTFGNNTTEVELNNCFFTPSMPSNPAYKAIINYGVMRFNGIWNYKNSEVTTRRTDNWAINKINSPYFFNQEISINQDLSTWTSESVTPIFTQYADADIDGTKVEFNVGGQIYLLLPLKVGLYEIEVVSVRESGTPLIYLEMQSSPFTRLASGGMPAKGSTRKFKKTTYVVNVTEKMNYKVGFVSSGACVFYVESYRIRRLM